ncbi:hypothetical protein WJX84_004285 [Apatococcus fuscideae]
MAAAGISKPAAAAPAAAPAAVRQAPAPAAPAAAPSQPGLSASMLAQTHAASLRLGAYARPGGIPGFPNMVALPYQQQAAKPSFKPAPLRLDDQGREIDEFGNVVQKPAESVTTLKINQKQDQKTGSEAQPAAGQSAVPAASFYDDTIGQREVKRLQRPRKAGFDFVQEGRFSRMAELQRIRAEFGDAGVKQHKERQAAERKLASETQVDANLIPLGQRAPAAAPEPEQIPLEDIPEVEWWDTRILTGPSYAEAFAAEGGPVRQDRVTLYVEHPVPIEPPAEPAAPPPMPLMLTKKEHKKLRTQRRTEREKTRQELIQQGLLEAPKPKVKLGNMMRVVAEQAVADPTAMEHDIRSQMAERQQAHDDRNMARMLTPSERKAKKEKKLLGAAQEGEAAQVSVFCIRDLSSPQNKFKVRVNAEELHMTGCAIITDAITVVVAEGGPKAQKRYKKLLLERIKWNAVPDDEDEAAAAARVPNHCKLMWEGVSKEPCFEKFVVEQCRTDAAAKKLLAERGVGHYWDIGTAVSAHD